MSQFHFPRKNTISHEMIGNVNVLVYLVNRSIVGLSIAPSLSNVRAIGSGMLALHKSERSLDSQTASLIAKQHAMCSASQDDVATQV